MAKMKDGGETCHNKGDRGKIELINSVGFVSFNINFQIPSILLIFLILNVCRNSF
jgi:hypothetical protein